MTRKPALWIITVIALASLSVLAYDARLDRFYAEPFDPWRDSPFNE